ncbi:MAG TPA: hypothetical protein VN181_03290, partial [Thermoanaerobaculia bacterium]|nr:hypothetical protein [Thermoanaerobaculia bacterium]
INFNAADSPYTLDALRDKVCNNLGVGDKIQCTLVNDGSNLRHFKLAVATTYVVEGTFLHLDIAGSTAGVLDALGFDRPVEDVTAPGIAVDSRGAQFPATTAAGSTLTLTLINQSGTTEAFTWNVGAQTFNSAAEVVTAIGAQIPNGSITASGGELHFTVLPTLMGTYTSLEASGPPDLLDALGLAKSREADGVVSFPARRTVKGNWNLIAGQAVAALLLNELTRPHTGPGADVYPNMPITAANEAAINALVASNIDPHRAILVCFLDPPPNQREGAAGGYVNAGIDNAGYLYRYQLFANMQIIYSTTADTTIAHELGHNVGFADLYNNSNDYLPAYRYAGNWDVMHAQGQFPHTDIWHKEIIAHWLTNAGANVGVFPEPAAMGAQTRHYVVTPLELGPAAYDNTLGGVPGGVTKVKGIRLPLGLGPVSDHHYLTITNRQAGASFSQSLPQKIGAPARGGIYIADSISPANWVGNLFNPSSRNVVHPLTDVALLASGDVSPVLDSAPATDINLLNTFPAYDGINVNVVGQLAGPGGFSTRPSLLVDVTREQKNFLDLAITPWGAPPYESIDIWIEHADGSLSAVPLGGNGEAARWSASYNPAANGGNPLNWIRVKVSNAGTVDATNVKVRVKVNQPGGMGDTGTWVAIPTSGPQDIPHGQSRIFNLPWTPKVHEHTCVQAEVISWDSPLGDRDPWNQRTQENVNDFAPTSSSPWAPVPMSFDISNNRTTPIDVHVAPQNLPPGYIVALDETFLTIPAKTKVLVHGTLTLDSDVIPPLGPNNPRPPKPGLFHITAALMNGEYQLPMGGITYRVFPNRRIHPTIDVVTDDGGNVVINGSTQPAAPGDPIEILVCYASGRCEWVETTTDGSGKVHVSVAPKEPGVVTVSVYEPPNYGPSGPIDTTVDPANPSGRSGASGIGNHELGIFAGAFFAAHKTRLESGFDTGFRYGRFVKPKWSLEGEGGIVFTRRFGDRGLLGHATVHALWHAGTATQPVRPFVLIGAGLASFQAGAYGDTTPALVWGGGADFRWRPDVGFRVDVRDFIMTDLFGNGTAHDLQVLWGVTFRF